MHSATMHAPHKILMHWDLFHFFQQHFQDLVDLQDHQEFWGCKVSEFSVKTVLAITLQHSTTATLPHTPALKLQFSKTRLQQTKLSHRPKLKQKCQICMLLLTHLYIFPFPNHSLTDTLCTTFLFHVALDQMERDSKYAQA